MPIRFRNAYYIKLGEKGAWEADSIAQRRMRIGWDQIDLVDMNAGAWPKVEERLRSLWTAEKQAVATRDLNRLRDIVDSTDEDIWVTFHGGTMWWARLKNGPVLQDSVSKYREIVDGWHNRPFGGGRVLAMNELPGKIVTVQGFRGTVCAIQDPELLQRVLSGERSGLSKQLIDRRDQLVVDVEVAIQALHWKDYESLVDMVFRHAGWQRVSVLGQQDRGYDLDLREPVLGERYVVQVKSRAGLAEFQKTIGEFSPEVYRKVFFVTHTPSPDLLRATEKDLPPHAVLVKPNDLALLALNAGLVSWLADKVA